MSTGTDMGYSASMAEVERIILRIKTSSAPDELPELVLRARGLLSNCEQALEAITTRTNAALQPDREDSPLAAHPSSTPA